MKIENNAKAIFEFKASEWFLVKVEDETNEWQWTLNYRIDRSEKGKDDDVGMPKIFLTEEEADMCKKAGFSWTEL